MSSSVKNLDIYIPPDDLLEGVKRVIAQVKPTWEMSIVKFKVFTEGISNQLMGCFHPCEPPGLLVRVYGVGTELFIDRAAERTTMAALAQAGQGPELLLTFQNGLVYHYVPGSVLTVDTVASPTLWPLVARRMAAMHQLPTSATPVLWNRLDNFLLLISEELFSNPRYSNIKLLFPTKSAINCELKWIKSRLDSSASPIVFCHNDLLLANVVVNPASDDVTFIDYEYAGSNYQAFDIANHFNEFAGVEEIDPDRIPGLDFQRTWIQEYLTSLHGASLTDDLLQNTVTQVRRFLGVSNLHWGLWALVQSLHSKIDFDFCNYAFIKLKLYFKTKELITGGE